MAGSSPRLRLSVAYGRGGHNRNCPMRYGSVVMTKTSPTSHQILPFRLARAEVAAT